MRQGGMTVHPDRLGRFAIWLLVGMLIAGVAAAAPAQSRLRVVGFAMPTTPPNVVHIPPWVAQDTGIFARHGIETKILTFEGGPAALRALVGGGREIQVAAPGVPPFVALLAQGADLKAIYSYSVKHPVAMVVQEDIKRCQDLKGKKLGTPGGVGAYVEVLTRALLQTCGLTPRDVQYVSLSTGARVVALSTRQVDGIIMHLDQVSEVIKQKQSLHILARLADVLPHGWYAAYVTTGALIRSDPKLVEDVVLSLVEANRFIYQNREKTIEIATKYTKFDRDIVEKTYDQLAALGVWPVNEGLRKDLIDAGLDTEVRIGDIPESEKPAYAQAVQLGFLNAAMTRLGRWTGDPRWY